MSEIVCPNLNSLPNCTIPASYICPDKGIALIPWIYSIILLVCHLVLVVVRIVKWEATQLLSMALAVYSLSVTILAYRSTHFAPEKIYSWTPISLTIDVGALMQIVVFLTTDDYGEYISGRLMTALMGRKNVSLTCRSSEPGPQFP